MILQLNLHDARMNYFIEFSLWAKDILQKTQSLGIMMSGVNVR